MSNKVKIALSIFTLTFLLLSFSKNDEITIFHYPPGNTENHNEISISINSLDAHLAHGDKIVCRTLEEYKMWLKLLGIQKDRLVMLF